MTASTECRRHSDRFFVAHETTRPPHRFGFCFAAGGPGGPTPLSWEREKLGQAAVPGFSCLPRWVGKGQPTMSRTPTHLGDPNVVSLLNAQRVPPPRCRSFREIAGYGRRSRVRSALPFPPVVRVELRPVVHQVKLALLSSVLSKVHLADLSFTDSSLGKTGFTVSRGVSKVPLFPAPCRQNTVAW